MKPAARVIGTPKKQSTNSGNNGSGMTSLAHCIQTILHLHELYVIWYAIGVPASMISWTLSYGESGTNCSPWELCFLKYRDALKDGSGSRSVLLLRLRSSVATIVSCVRCVV